MANDDYRSREELQVELARVRSLFENAPLPYQSLDENGFFLDVNRRWLETLGYEKDEVLGRWFGDFLGPGFQEHFGRNFPIFKDACAIDGVEFDMVRKDASHIRVSFNGRVQLDGSGEFLRTHCIFTDITERRRMEDSLTFLITSGWNPAGGESFFDSLAVYLAKALGMEFICIDVLEGDGQNATTLSVYHDGKFEDNITYSLKDTPCGEAAGKIICTYERDVHKRFPKDELLQQMKAQSYAGTTLFSSKGEPIGLIACIGKTPLHESSFAENLLRMASIRAAGELERKIINDGLLRSRESLRKSLEEKMVLMREVHHRVKNNLQILMSLVNLQAGAVTEEGEAQALAAMQSRIRSIALVHERLYRSPDLGAVCIKGYLEELTDQIGKPFREAGSPVAPSIDVEEMDFGVDKAIPLGLLVNELVTNAYKHAFRPGVTGRLGVSLKRENGLCTLTVTDDGPGLPAGLDPSRAHTLGLQLVSALVGQLKGQSVRTGPPGTRYEVVFPHCG
ncbi:MAG: PAS domain-containing sensor histidine kinase [Thermodesulfobacteriota bacterium]